MRIHNEHTDKETQLSRKTCVRIGVTCMVIFLLIHYWDAAIGVLAVVGKAAFTLLAGCAIAYVVNIPMCFFERHYPFRSSAGQKARRPLCLLAAFVAIILILALVFYMVVPELLACVQLLLDKLPGVLTTAYEWLDGEFQISALFQDQGVSFSGSEIEWQDAISKTVDLLVSGVGGAAGIVVDAVSSVASGIVTLVVAFVFSLYLLAGKERVGRQVNTLVTAYLPQKIADRSYDVAHTLDRSFHSYIVGQCIEAVILGTLCALGMVVLRLPYAAMIGSLVAVTALIPVAGAYIGGIVGVLMILTESPVKAVIFVIFLVILQQLEGNLIYPRVVGASIGLPGIWVLAAVTVGGGVGGIGGMLLAVPLAAAIYQMLKNDAQDRKAAKEDPQAPAQTGAGGLSSQPVDAGEEGPDIK